MVLDNSVAIFSLSGRQIKHSYMKEEMIGYPIFILGMMVLALQVYISWAIRQRIRSCKVLMIINYTLPDTEFITLNSQPQ